MQQLIRKRMERMSYANERRRPDSGTQRRGRVPIIQKGNEYSVKIESLGHKGDGMVKIEDFTVFVKNAEVGEEVRVKITKVMETVAFADRLN